jgi:imidazolonepropionase-like amidohydrolase
MRPSRRLLIALALGLPVSLCAQEKPIAFKASLIPIAGEPVTAGVLIVHRGKITAIGPASTTAIPPDATVHDLAGRTLMPGLIDSHSHIGGGSGADGSAPIQPDARVLDSFDVRDPSVQKAQAGGVTTANVMPGSGHLISGQTLYLKLRDGRTIDDLLIPLPDGRPAGGLKMANGTNSIRAAPFPGTRAKSAALVREQFLKAQDYREKIRRAGNDPEKLPARDLAMEQLIDALEGRRIVHHHTHRHDDILTVLRLTKEFGLKVVLHHVSDGWKVPQEIAAAGVGASVIMLDSPGGKIEARDVDWRTPMLLEKAGVLVGFHTDDGITDSRLFLRSAALGVRVGMSRKAALEAVTIANAKLLGLESRIGSLEVGKDADFIVLSGDPLSVYTHVEQTWIDGAKVFDRANAQDRLYAVGGPGAGDPRRAFLCCFTSAWDLITAANLAEQ